MDSQSKAIDTWLPLFRGFYNTIWDGDAELTEYCNEYNVDSDDVEVDWHRFRRDVATTLVKEMEQDLIGMGLIESMAFQKIISPRYYNYDNDSIDVSIVPNVDAISKYIVSNINEFDAYVKKRYTSYDGFTSFRFNSALEWANDTIYFTMLDKDGHTLGCLLDFILTNEGVEDDEYLSRVNMNMYFDEYCEVNYTELQSISNNEARVKIIRDNIDDIDLEHGYLKVLSDEARAKSILLGSDFIEELVEIAYSELVDALPFNKVSKDLEPINHGRNN
jgi:hypothetical protein